MKKAWIIVLATAMLLSVCGCADRAGKNSAQTTLDAEAETGRVELVMATIGESASFGADRRIYSAADGFNASQERYHLTVVNYNTGENGNTAAGEEQGMTRLLTEIAAGQYPDLICFDNISPYPFIAKGVLLDMESCMAEDEDIRIEDIMCYRALRAWGGVYLMGDWLSADGLYALRSRFGDRDGWTIQEYLDIESSLPEGARMLCMVTKEQFLERMVMNYLGTAIDWENGTCSFNNQSFIALLEAARRIRETELDSKNDEFGDNEKEYLQAGRYIAAYFGVPSPFDIEYFYEDWMTPIGWPTVDGRCGTMVYYQNPVGIMAQSEHIDGAWAFVKYLLMTPDENNFRMPSWRPLMEDALQRAQHSETFPCITAEQGEAFMALLDRVEIFYKHDPIVLNIIMKECEPFLAGERSAEDTAARIQSRMQIYVAEQG